MKIKLNETDSNIVKENSTYTLFDNTELNNLVVSKTILHPNKCTTGHVHYGQEEVYQFVSGEGYMEIGYASSPTLNVSAGDTVLIPDGHFHKVHNKSKYEDLVFICVFDGKRCH